jgi:hypothetical protein
MTDEDAVQRCAREAVKAGKLPDRLPSRMWAGNGFGASCAICDELVKPDEIGYEIEFDETGGSAASREFCIHARCYAAWHLERRVPADQSLDQGNQSPDGVSNGSSHGGAGRSLLSDRAAGGTMPHRDRHPQKREST